MNQVMGRRTTERTVVRELVFDLMGPDWEAKARLAGQQRRTLLEIQARLEDAKKQAKLDAERAENELNITLACLAAGKESRSVECQEVKDFAAGKVEYWYQGVCMAERPLEPHERQGEMAV